MRLIEVLESQIIVDNPIRDLDTFCLNELVRTYEGKCFRRKFIRKIISIIERSSCTVLFNPPGSGRISVRFQAEVDIYPSGSIIPNCEIQQLDRQGRIFLKKDNIYIQIRANKELMGLAKNNTLNIRVSGRGAFYKPFSENITTNGHAYIYPSMDSNIYEVTTSGVELQEYPELDLSDVNNMKFYNLLYMYKKAPKAPKGAKLVSLHDLVKLTKKVWVQRPPQINNADPVVYVWEKAPTMADLNIVSGEDPTVLLNGFILEITEHRNAIIEMAGKYDTKTKYEANKKVWQLYNQYKKS